MLNQAQNFAEFGQAQFDKMIKLSSVLLSNAERLTNLNIELSQKALSDNAKTFKTIAESKEQKTLSDVHGSIIQPSIDQALSAACQLCEATMSTQNEIHKVMEEQLTDINKSLLATLDHVSKNAPNGSESAIEAFKQFINSANNALSSASEVARKSRTKFAEDSVKAASASMKTNEATTEQKAPVKK